MHIWRIPLPFFAAVVASTTLALVWIGTASLRARVPSIVGRGVLLGAAVVAAILSPLLVHAITGNELERMAKLGVYTHYSPYLYVAPAFVVALLCSVSRIIFPRRGITSASRWHLTFWLTALAFTVLNVANWCSPGWCERFGFPFSYSWWSDAIVVMNGENLTAGSSLIALGANVSVFFLIVAALRRAYHRSVRLALENTSSRSSASEPCP